MTGKKKKNGSDILQPLPPGGGSIFIPQQSPPHAGLALANGTLIHVTAEKDLVHRDTLSLAACGTQLLFPTPVDFLFPCYPPPLKSFY